MSDFNSVTLMKEHGISSPQWLMVLQMFTFLQCSVSSNISQRIIVLSRKRHTN